MTKIVIKTFIFAAHSLISRCNLCKRKRKKNEDNASFSTSINEVSSYIATRRNLRGWDGFRSGRPYASMNMHENLSSG